MIAPDLVRDCFKGKSEFAFKRMSEIENANIRKANDLRNVLTNRMRVDTRRLPLNSLVRASCRMRLQVLFELAFLDHVIFF